MKDDWVRDKTRRLNAVQHSELASLVETRPDRAVHGVVRWRRVDLQKLINDRFRALPRADDRQAPEAPWLLAHNTNGLRR